MARFERVRANIRRAYETSRDTVQAARRSDRADKDDPVDDAAVAESTAELDGPRPEGTPPSIDETVPRSLRIAAAWSWRLILVGAVGYALLWLVDRFLILVAPLMIGLLLAGLLAPAQRWLVRLRVNRSLAALLVLVAGLAAVGGTLTLVVNQIVAAADDLAESAEAAILGLAEWLQTGPLGLTDADFETLVRQAQQWLAENRERVTAGVLGVATTTIQILTGIVLVLVITFFFLRDGERIWRFVVRLLPTAARGPSAYAGEGAWRTLSGYVRATVLVAFIDAVGIGLGLWILDVPLALPLAALVFLGAFVPIVGAFLSGTMAVLVAFVDGGIVPALLVLGVVLLVQQVEGNVLQPVIMSRAVKIHPLAVIIAVTAGILLAGIIGALVAVPIVAVINTMVRRLSSYHRRAPVPGEIPIPAR